MYRLKDKKIRIFYKKEKEKINGRWTYEYPQYINEKLWAFYQHGGGRLDIEKAFGSTFEIDGKTAIFVIENRPDVPVKVEDYVVYNDTIYDITVVDDFRGNSKELKLTCRKAVAQDPNNYDGMFFD